MSLDWKEKENLNILVVDDFPILRSTIKDMLRTLGYPKVAEAEDGLRAWDILLSSHVDVAIVDRKMPNLNGIDLLRRTHADIHLANIPFIMVSGEVGVDTIAEAAETEVDAYIIKPFNAVTLERKIIQVLNRKKNPQPIDMILTSVYAATQTNQFSRAKSELNKANLLQPRDPRVSLGYAELYKQMGMPVEAEKAYKKALVLEPKFIKAHDGLADLYKKISEEKKLLTALNEAVAISPRNATRQVTLGKLYLETGMMEDAKKAFGSALKAEPNNTVVHNEMAEILLAKDMDKEAVTYFQAVLKVNPEDIHIYNRLGIAFRKQGKYQEAISEYKKAIRIAPNDENLYYNLGRAYLEADSKEEALKQFEISLACNPSFRDAKEMMDATQQN